MSNGENQVVSLPTDQICRPANRGRYAEKPDPTAVTMLSQAIQSQGQQQPVLVMKRKGLNSEGKEVPYTLVFGWTRTAACEYARIPVKAFIIDDPGDRKALELSVDENLKRQTLNPIDLAITQERLRTAGWKGGEIAAHYSMTDARVSQLKKLLTLPDDCKNAIVKGLMTGSGGLQLARLADIVPPAEGELAEAQQAVMLKSFKTKQQADADGSLSQSEWYDTGEITKLVDARFNRKSKADKKAEDEAKAGQTVTTPDGTVAPAVGTVGGDAAKSIPSEQGSPNAKAPEAQRPPADGAALQAQVTAFVDGLAELTKAPLTDVCADLLSAIAQYWTNKISASSMMARLQKTIAKNVRDTEAAKTKAGDKK